MKIASRLRFEFALAVMVCGLFGVGEARAGLSGYSVSGGFAFNTSGGPFDPGTVFTISGSTTVPGTLVQVPIYSFATFTDSSITQVVNVSFNTFPFNGYLYESEASAPIFTGVTLVSSTAAGFTAADISFNAHEVALNFSGLSTVGTVDLDFTTAAVPEPSSRAQAGPPGR
jgi:hypothetical protein